MKKAWIGATAAGLFFAYACGADPLFLDETDAIITVRGEDADFSKFETYYMPTRIVDLCLQPESGTPTSEAIGGAAGGPSIDPGNCYVTDHTTDEAVLAALASNMDKLGYVRLDEEDRDDADLALLVGIVSRTAWSLQRAYCYPNDYYPGCVDQSGNPELSVPNNSFVIQLIDVDASGGDTLIPAWTVGVHQLQKISSELGTSVGDGPSATKATIWVNSINTAFDQSPYLAEGGK